MLFFAACLSIPTVVALGQQQDKGVIVGTVTDSTGAAIPGATVTIVNAATNATDRLVTNGEGFYTSAPLQIGTYTVTAVKPGFETMNEPDVVIDVGTRSRIDFPMHPGSVQAEVTVSSESPALNSTSATIGTVIDERTLEGLPLNGGNALALAALAPGISSAFGATSSGFNDRGTQLSAIRISGGAVGANAITLDGTNNQLTYIGEVAINPQVDSITQFRLITGVASAQYGFTSGGVIDIASRSGSNKLHGTVYEFIRNDVIDAQNYFASTTLHKPELRYNRFGGSIGGYAIRDKLFYFANVEPYKLVMTNPSFSTMPTPLERDGDFSQSGVNTAGTCLPITIYDTTTSTPKPYTDDKIPMPNMDPAALAIQNTFYPLPNNSIGNFDPCSHANNYVSNTKLKSSQMLTLERIDYQVTKRDNIFARYAFYHFLTNNAGIYPDVTASGRNDDVTNQSLTVGYTRTVSRSSVNDLRFGIIRASLPANSGSYNQNWLQRVGIDTTNIIPGNTLPSLGNGLPVFNTQIGNRTGTQFQITDTLTRQIGNHALAVGVDLRLGQAYNNQNPLPGGQFNFSQTSTSANPANGTPVPGSGSQYASFLVGEVTTAEAYVANGVTFRNTSYSGFIQDDWRAARGLTLNIGIRYDYQQQPYALGDKTSNFDLNRTDNVNGYFGAMVYSGHEGYGHTFNKENYTDFSPRFGFAWNVPHTRNSILRGGFATYYSSTANASFGGSTNGFGATTTTYQSSIANGIALFLKDGLPTSPNINSGVAGGPNAFLGNGAVLTQDEVQPTPRSQIFTLTVSRQLPGHWVVDVSYLGNRGTHFVQPSYSLDQINPSYLSLGDALLAQVPNPYAGKIPGSLGNATVAYMYTKRPYPYYGSVADYQPHTGSYFGNYMYVSLQRRVSKGIQVITSYTLGKIFSDPIYVPLSTAGGISTGPSGSYQNAYNRKAEFVIDPLDVTHRLTTSVISRLPFGPDERFLRKRSIASTTLKDWTLNAILTLQSGRPLTLTGANNQGFATRPNFSGVNPLSGEHHTQAHWFNTDAFVNPPNYTFGTVPRALNQLRGPGAVNLDASLARTVPVHRGYNLQLRFEGFNVVNTPPFGQPNTSFTADLGLPPNTNANFGRILSAGSGRVFQAGAKLQF